MAKNLDIGRAGEAFAKVFLEDGGFEILHQNWRHSHFEIDIIAAKANVLHFVEVKTRSSGIYGPPEENVTRKKLGNLISAGEAYLDLNPHWMMVQYDILSINLNGKSPPEYFFIEDVYL